MFVKNQYFSMTVNLNNNQWNIKLNIYYIYFLNVIGGLGTFEFYYEFNVWGLLRDWSDFHASFNQYSPKSYLNKFIKKSGVIPCFLN